MNSSEFPGLTRMTDFKAASADRSCLEENRLPICSAFGLAKFRKVVNAIKI